MSAEMIELILLPIVVLLPFTVVDAGMGILFVTLAVRSIDQDSLFRSMTFLFGALLLCSSIYVSVISVASLVNQIIALLP